MVVEAVLSEPVSGAGTAISLLNREKTGIFFAEQGIFSR